MKKSSFVALVMGVVSVVLFGLGMCMALLPEWEAFREGVIFGVVGLVLGLITLLVWRKMEGKPPVKLNRRRILIALFGLAGALVLGLGLCFCMVWERLVIGTLIGVAGLVMLLSLIPVVKGFR